MEKVMHEYAHMKTYDLNLFYKEDWTKETGTTVSSTLTIEPYLYIADEQGARRYERPIIELTQEETDAIAPLFPEHEYGTDWWIDMYTFLEHDSIPESLRDKLTDLPDIEKYVFDKRPSWWIWKKDQDDVEIDSSRIKPTTM
jgi:hypothetical protein